MACCVFWKKAEFYSQPSIMVGLGITKEKTPDNQNCNCKGYDKKLDPCHAIGWSLLQTTNISFLGKATKTHKSHKSMRAKHQHERVLHKKRRESNWKYEEEKIKIWKVCIWLKNEVKNSGIICNLNNEIKCRIFYRSLIVWPRTA